VNIICITLEKHRCSQKAHDIKLIVLVALQKIFFLVVLEILVFKLYLPNDETTVSLTM